MKRYKLSNTIPITIVASDNGKYVLFEDVKDLENKLEATDRRHREVRDAIAEERDDLRKRMAIIQVKAAEMFSIIKAIVKKLKENR